MSRPQKGRKPRKPWHKKQAAAELARALEHWPATASANYDGAPRPLPQGKSRAGDKAMRS